MKINSFLLTLFLSMISPIFSIKDNARDLFTATEEMQKANYFTFVMLIKMSPPDTRLEENITFLMPNDRMLANMTLREGYVSDFLLRHSIPSPLLFDILKQFPSGTIVPSLLPNCTLRISNNGRRNFGFNNVKIISPNICMAGSSIRCHGIDGVLAETCTLENNYSVPILPSPCPNNNTNISCNASPPTPPPFSPPTPSIGDKLNPPIWMAPIPAITNIEPHKSGSPRWFYYDAYFICVACLMLSSIRMYL
ncbi:FAS1 domain-containing protein SELMODRAFT_448915-like [Vicia villosa]|uniref:FAS1 domain-containing protein SELMODRAFT_448915-like n=1 Tax=Vicia villosa TaxID=3911 RepID=UPI00273C6E9F|nr:FAS1 domain-containing protein SELMODRAFT_448915-like [Vicia villosa]